MRSWCPLRVWLFVLAQMKKMMKHGKHKNKHKFMGMKFKHKKW